MSLLQEATLVRLWARYERVFRAPPPIQSVTIDETIAYLWDALEASSTCRHPLRRVASPKRGLGWARVRDRADAAGEL